MEQQTGKRIFKIMQGLAFSREPRDLGLRVSSLWPEWETEK
jgi:hypothetical protein